MTTRGTNNQGFTLAELLVGTMLLTIVMTSVYTLFHTVIATWRSEESDEGLHREAREILTLIGCEYNNMHPTGNLLFEGTNSTFTMYTVVQPMNVDAGENRRLMRVRYTYDPTRQELAREEALVNGPLPVTLGDTATFDRGRIVLADLKEFVLANRVTDFQVHYLWIARPGPEYWENPPVPVEPRIANRQTLGIGLPQAIEIKMTLAGSGDSETPVTVSARFATRAYTRQRDAWELNRMLEDLG